MLKRSSHERCPTMPTDEEKETLPQLVLREENVMHWSPEAFDALVARIENPDLTPSPEMRESLRRKPVWNRRKP